MSDLATAGQRIESLLDAASSGGVVARERAEELVRLVTDLYGTGLERVLDLLYDSGRLDDDVLAMLAGDELVSGLLLVHGLHPYDAQTRVEQALDSVRPYLGSHGGDVELLEVTPEGAVKLRLLGSCDGCPSSSVTLELAVRDAIESAAPEVVSIDVEESAAAEVSGPLIPVGALRTRLDESPPSQEPGVVWHSLPVAGISPGSSVVVDLADSRVLVCEAGGYFFAFRDRCARCEGSLEGSAPARRLGGSHEDVVLRCPTCRAHFAVRRAGAGLDDPELHLEPLPLLVEGPTVAIALPTAVVA